MSTQELTIGQYALELFGGEDNLLREMRTDAEREGLPAIQVPPELGRLLEVLIAASGARRVLEIGTLFGYSAVIISRALPSDGELTTLEVNSTHAALARENIRRAGFSDQVSVIEGPAAASLERLDSPFDLVFIDADKAAYPTYLRHALRLSRVGTIIVADNLWRYGSVRSAEDADSQGAAEYNRAVAGDPRLATTLISTRDGGDAAGVSVVRAI